MLGENVITTTKGNMYVTAVPQQFLLNVSGPAKKVVKVTVAEVVDETSTKETIENKAILEAPAECVNVLKVSTTKGNVNINVK